MLADPGAPLVLADGTVINPATGKEVKQPKNRGGFISIPSAGEAVAIVAKSRRSVAELPLPPKQMTGFGLVLFYTMWGLNDSDIALTIGGLSEDQVKQIKKLPEYKTIEGDIVKTVLEHESNDIRTFFKQNANQAAQKIVALVDEDGALGLKASQDILDRAGFRPADVHEHTHKFEDALKIEYINKQEVKDLPIINADFEVIE